MDQLQALLQGHGSPDTPPSKLQVFSYGNAAENLALNSFDLEILPLEVTPMVDGEISTNANQVQSQGQDISGATYQTAATSSGTIKATWLPLGQPNRMTPPNVRRGEEVVIYRFGDNDKYYWNSARNDLAFRRLETVVWAISAVPEEGKAADKSGTYFLEISSHKKSITLSTSKGNGEPYAYLFTFDLANGKVSLSDDIDNVMFLDSTQNQWHIENGDGSFFDMTHKAMSGYAADSIDFKTKAYSIESETYELDASSSITEKTNNRTLTASQNEITATTTHNGALTENGPLQLNGDMTTAPGTGSEGGTGKISIKGEAELLGDLDVKGNLTAVTIEATTSITAPNLQYN